LGAIACTLLLIKIFVSRRRCLRAAENLVSNAALACQQAFRSEDIPRSTSTEVSTSTGEGSIINRRGQAFGTASEFEHSV